MLKFRNYKNELLLAQGELTYSETVNGEKSLTGLVYNNDDVLFGLDKGWSVQFNDKWYHITYVAPTDKGNKVTVEFDAVHEFFFNMAKSVAYGTLKDGSHTAKEYLDFVFNGSGYSYTLLSDVNAFEKQGFGDKNRLSLFNEIIEDMEMEFSIADSDRIMISTQVGQDLSTIVRKGFNLQEWRLEYNVSDFVTYAKGFGAYKNKDDESAGRYEAEYTSPLASVYGKLEADPVTDERFTSVTSLKKRLQEAVDSSYKISVDISLAELQRAGYDYDSPTPGDYVLAVDEQLKFERKIRILGVEEKYDVNGNRVSSTVTAGSISDTKEKLSGATESNTQLALKHATEQAEKAVTSANGKNTNYYGIVKPNNPQEGDTWYWEDGENSGIKVFKNGEWVDVVDTQTQERITNEVKNAVDTATAYADKLNSTQAEATNSLADELDKKADELTKSQQTIASQASAYTDSAVADANAKAVQIGQTTAQNAQKALDERATTLQQSIDTKVAKTEYDKKTGELTTNVNTAQQTANTATQTIGTYKQTNDKRVAAAEVNIKANADAIALTASKTDLDKVTGELSGSIGELKVTAKDITQTVSDLQTKVNNLGQTNLLNNTEFTPDLEGWELSSNGNSRLPYRSYLQPDIKSVVVGYNTVDATSNSYSLFRQTVQLASTTGSGNKMSLSWASIANRIDNYANVWVRFFDKTNTKITDYVTKWANTGSSNTWKIRNKWEGIEIPDTARSVLISFEAREGTNAYLGQPMMVYGETIGDYIQGNYNNNASLAQVKLTADGLDETVNNPKTGIATRLLTAEGSIIKVQDATNNLTAKQTLTANGLTQEIADRQTGDTNTLQAGKDFTTSQIKSYDTGMQSQIGQMSDGIFATVSTTNLVVDSSLVNGIDNWEVLSGDGKWYYSGLTMYNGVASIGINVSDSSGSYNRINSKPISTGNFGGNTVYVSVDVLARSIGTSSTDYLIVYLHEQDSTGKNINSTSITGTLKATNNSWVNYRKKITLDSNTKSLYINYQLRGNGNVYVSRPYVGNVELPAGGYTPGTPNNNTTVLSLLKDNWRIGIADNIGLITSGIVGDSNSINLISKNVTIDSPNTQIKGTAWITTAMIGDGQIGTAKIGDLAVTSAKISELDVNKLSGNITNFIKSYWSNAYQNLQIDANAIDFTTSNSRTKIENGSLTMWQNAGGYYRLGGIKALKSTAGDANNHTAGVYLALDEWQTTNKGDKYYDYGGQDFFGGSEIGIVHSTGVDSNGNPKYGALMKWSNPLAASRTDGLTKGFNFFDDINFQGHNILVNGAANKMKFTWVSWSDWGNYHNIALTNETSKSGIAMNNDNLVLFGGGKRADATTGWKA